MHKAPPVISSMEFFGLQNKLILVECDEDDCPLLLIHKAFLNSYSVIYTTEPTNKIHGFIIKSLLVKSDNIGKIFKSIKNAGNSFDFYVINRIDLMNLELSKRARGSQIKSYLSMISKNILLGSNLIVTSCSAEYSIREIADVTLKLKK